MLMHQAGLSANSWQNKDSLLTLVTGEQLRDLKLIVSSLSKNEGYHLMINVARDPLLNSSMLKEGII